jgi:hypothetical protein
MAAPITQNTNQKTLLNLDFKDIKKKTHVIRKKTTEDIKKNVTPLLISTIKVGVSYAAEGLKTRVPCFRFITDKAVDALEKSLENKIQTHLTDLLSKSFDYSSNKVGVMLDASLDSSEKSYDCSMKMFGLTRPANPQANNTQNQHSDDEYLSASEE